MLPFVHNIRRAARARGHHSTAEGYLACGPCLQALPAEARQEWNCGFEQRIPGRRGEYPLPDGAPRPTCDTCPGYLISLPQVAETAKAYPWFETGQLRDYCDGDAPSPVLREYVGILHVAVADAAIERMRQDREEATTRG